MCKETSGISGASWNRRLSRGGFKQQKEIAVSMWNPMGQTHRSSKHIRSCFHNCSFSSGAARCRWRKWWANQILQLPTCDREVWFQHSFMHCRDMYASCASSAETTSREKLWPRPSSSRPGRGEGIIAGLEERPRNDHMGRNIQSCRGNDRTCGITCVCTPAGHAPTTDLW